MLHGEGWELVEDSLETVVFWCMCWSAWCVAWQRQTWCGGQPQTGRLFKLFSHLPELIRLYGEQWNWRSGGLEIRMFRSYHEVRDDIFVGLSEIAHDFELLEEPRDETFETVSYERFVYFSMLFLRSSWEPAAHGIWLIYSSWLTVIYLLHHSELSSKICHSIEVGCKILCKEMGSDLGGKARMSSWCTRCRRGGSIKQFQWKAERRFWRRKNRICRGFQLKDNCF